MNKNNDIDKNINNFEFKNIEPKTPFLKSPNTNIEEDKKTNEKNKKEEKKEEDNKKEYKDEENKDKAELKENKEEHKIDLFWLFHFLFYFLIHLFFEYNH